MNDTNPAPTTLAYIASLVTMVGLVIALVDRFSEPFNGTTAGFTGRILGAMGIGLVALSNIWTGRGRVAVLWTGVGVGTVGLIVAIAGRVS